MKANAATAMNALIIEDDKATADFVSKGLRENGFACDRTASGVEGLQKITMLPYNVAIVDIKLADDMSGLDLIMAARRKGVKTPIIVLSAMDESFEKTAGLNAGADDYLGKPFALSELLARVFAQMRRSSYSQCYDLLKVKDLVLSRETHEARRGNRQISLTHGEYALLELLMRNTGRPVPAKMILQSVWDTDYAPSKIVETRICSLRKKLCANGEPDMITTMRGFGYVLK